MSRSSTTTNDENMSPLPATADASMSMQPSEPPSSPLVSNSFLYNLPDPTVGLPGHNQTSKLNVLPSPIKRSAIASLNKPLSHQQTRDLESARILLNPLSAQAVLDAPGGLPTPPSSSEALTHTPPPSTNLALAPLPNEPVSPSPARNSRAAAANFSPAARSNASRASATPSRIQRGSTSRLLSTNNDSESDNDDEASFRVTPKQKQALGEIDEDSDEDAEEEEEIQLISFKRGGPDSTFIREIKENGWDQPLPPCPIKFTYLEPAAPRPPRRSSASLRSRSKTPQIRASPAPSHASSSRARSVRASSTTADQTADRSDESIKSSDTTLTNISRISTRSVRASRASVAPPPVVVADLTRDHPSLPDSPGDDPLLLTGPDTYLVYHDQTPSHKQRAASVRPTASSTELTHSTPLPLAAEMMQRRDSAGSAASEGSRSSLYARMSGRSADADVSVDVDRDDAEEEEAPFTAWNDDAGFDSDSDADQDEHEEKELEEGEQSPERRDVSRARSFVDDESEEQDDDEENDDDNASAVNKDDAQSGEESPEDEDEASEDEDEDDDDDDEQEFDEEDEDITSQLDEDEQSALLDSVVIISSSASPSTASALTRSRSASTRQHSEEEEEEFVVGVVRDSRDRSLGRRSEHSAIHDTSDSDSDDDDEPQIHTLHLRQPIPDETAHSASAADASHSRSRVLKLGQATSTPIVEISSLDPRAAARATAILKLFHKYVDEGWIAGDATTSAAAAVGSSTEMGERMRRVVDAIRQAEQRGRRVADASGVREGHDAAADLTTLLMDAELSLAREGTAESESLLDSRATSIVSTVPAAVASPATPFLPGGFRATPASTCATQPSTAVAAESPSIIAASRSITAADSSTTSTLANLTRRTHTRPSSDSFTFPGLSTPDRSSRRPAKQARLSSALQPPSLSSFNPRSWDTQDWVRLDKYFALGVKKISRELLAGSTRTDKARSYLDALFGVDVSEVAQMFLDEMQVPSTSREGEWSNEKVEHRLEALQRKYLRKVQAKYPEALHEGEVASRMEAGEESMRSEDLDWSLNANTTAASRDQGQSVQAGGKGRVSFGTPYRMGAHSTPAAGLLKKATSRAARDAMAVRDREGIYPSLPSPPPATPATVVEGEGVITKASRLISRLSGSFGGLISSPRIESADKGKRKATEAELDEDARNAAPTFRRRMEDSAPRQTVADATVSSTSTGDSTVESLLSSAQIHPSSRGGMTSTINASFYTNATSIHPDTSHSAAPGKQATTASSTLPTSTRGEGGISGLGSSLQLTGGSSGVSHTPLSLLSPGTHMQAKKKVDELRQRRQERNWVSPRRQRVMAAPASAGAALTAATSATGAGRRTTRSGGGEILNSSTGARGVRRSSSLAEMISSSAAREAVDARRRR